MIKHGENYKSVSIKVWYSAILLFTCLNISLVNSEELDFCDGIDDIRLTLHDTDGGTYKDTPVSEIRKRLALLPSEFSVNIISHVKKSIQERNLCKKEQLTRINIVFDFYEYTLIMNNAPKPVLPSKSNYCRIESPWVDISINKSDRFKIHILAKWDARQFIIDQSLMREPSVFFEKQPEKLTMEQLVTYVDRYLLSTKGQINIQHKNINDEGFIPFEMHWLYDNSLYLFESNQMLPGGSNSYYAKNVLKGYQSIVNTLFDKCLDSPDEKLLIRDIREFSGLQPLFDIDKYKFQLRNN